VAPPVPTATSSASPTSDRSGEFGNTVLELAFPLILLLFEWGLKRVLAVDTREFIGPTLAATGLSFLVPLTKPKKSYVAVDVGKFATVRAKWDEDFIPITLLFIFLFFFVWLASCYVSLKYPYLAVVFRSYSMSLQIVLGALAYFISLVMTGIKKAL
jgi:hypothetical protein